MFYLVAVERNEPMNIIETMKDRGILGEVCALDIFLETDGRLC